MIVLDVCSTLRVLMTYTYFVGLEEVPQHMLGDQRTTFGSQLFPDNVLVLIGFLSPDERFFWRCSKPGQTKSKVKDQVYLGKALLGDSPAPGEQVRGMGQEKNT